MPAAETLRAVVLDASVAVRWVIEEDGSTEAVILLNQEIGWIAPRLLLTEVASALRRKVADGAVEAALAGQALDTLLQAVADGIVHLADDERIVSQALLLAISLEHKLPDCMYLALAEREGAAIATADVRLARLARGRHVDVLLVPHG
jgi:predicted nucleic acid-binding protein